MLKTVLLCAVSGVISGMLCNLLVSYLQGTSDTTQKRRGLLFCTFFSALVFALIGLKIGTGLNTAPIYAFAALAVCISLTDIREKIIPDAFIVAGIFCAGCYILFSFVLTETPVNVPDAIIGAVAGSLPLFLVDLFSVKVLKRDGMGYGDVKLAGVCGMFLGGTKTVFFLVTAFIICGAAITIPLILKKLKKTDEIAFGPYLCASAVIWLIFGSEIIGLYGNLINATA